MKEMSLPSAPVLKLNVVVVLFLEFGVKSLECDLLEGKGGDGLFGLGCL